MRSKETYYFQHDYEPTSDPKVQVLLDKFGGMGYGVFWRIIEMLHSSESHRLELKEYLLTALANQMLTDVKLIKEIIDYLIDPCEVLMRDDCSIWSPRVNRNFELRKEFCMKKAEYGRRGGLAKAKHLLSET